MQGVVGIRIPLFTALSIYLLTAVMSAQTVGLSVDRDSIRVVDSLQNTSQENAPDSAATAGDSLEQEILIDSSETIIEYPDFYDEQIEIISSPTGDSIMLIGNQDRMYFTLRDAVRPVTSFYALKFGPPGQSYSLTYLGLPPYLYSYQPDHAGSFEVYQFPPMGMPDMRLFSLEQGDVLLIDTDDPMTGTASISACATAFNDKSAYSEVQIFKGDFSYANTDVLFKQNTSDRFGWGFRVGIEKSNGYVSSSAKERDNYNVTLKYKLTPKWQFASTLRFMNIDDKLSQLGRWQSVIADGDRSLSGLTVLAMKRDSAHSALNISAWWQKFEEKVVANRFYLRQLHEQSGMKLSFRRTAGEHSVFFRPQLYYNHIMYERGYNYYTRVIADGGVNLRANNRLSCIVAGNYLFDWGNASRVGGTLRPTYEFAQEATVYASGTVRYVPPSDMTRFLKPKGIDFNSDGFPEYNHGGDPSLKPTMLVVASTGIVLKRAKWSISANGKTGRINDMVIWQSYDGSHGGLYQSEAVDANLLSGSLEAGLSLFDRFSFKSSYTYVKVEQVDSKDNLSVMPRHNVYGSVTLKQFVNKYRLCLVPSIEAEYHSEDFSSYANPAKLDDYLLLHVKLSARIKNLSFYYTMENIFNKTHQTVYDYPMNRRVWWGLRWIFFD